MSLEQIIGEKPLDLDAYLQARQTVAQPKKIADPQEPTDPPSMTLESCLFRRSKQLGEDACFIVGPMVICKACYITWGVPCRHRVTIDDLCKEDWWYATNIVKYMKEHNLTIPDHFAPYLPHINFKI